MAHRHHRRPAIKF